MTEPWFVTSSVRNLLVVVPFWPLLFCTLCFMSCCVCTFVCGVFFCLMKFQGVVVLEAGLITPPITENVQFKENQQINMVHNTVSVSLYA